MLAKTMTLKFAKEIAGFVSSGNTKMPGSTFAIATNACNVGSKLRDLKGSVCHRCYAAKLEKMRPSVRISYQNNLDKAVALIATNPVLWAEAMAFQINLAAMSSGEYYHRWFDSGDLQSVEMLYAICLVCKLTPNISHWLPTREAAIVDKYMASFDWLPENLTLRMSSVMIDDKPIMRWANTSTVHSKKKVPQGSHLCPAKSDAHRALSKDGKTANCGTCRACWDRMVENVSYPLD